MKHFKLVLWIIVLFCLAGCARSRSLIILLPDTDGQVGRIHVETGRGFIALDKSYESVAVHNHQVPETLRTMSRQEVVNKFEQVLASEPTQRFQFKKQAFYCQRNSAALMPSSASDLPEAIRQMIVHPPMEIYVVGHADRVGTEKYNRQLSHRRAQTFQQELIAQGISSRIIMISYLGESKPQIDTPDEVEEPRNRRVELILKYPHSL